MPKQHSHDIRSSVGVFRHWYGSWFRRPGMTRWPVLTACPAFWVRLFSSWNQGQLSLSFNGQRQFQNGPERTDCPLLTINMQTDLQYRVVQKSVCYLSISASRKSAVTNSLSYDAWLVPYLPAFLEPILSSTWCFCLQFCMFIVLRMSPFMQQWSVIRYFVLCEKSNQQIAAKLAKGHGHDALCLRPWTNWQLSFAPGSRMLKTIRDLEGSLTMSLYASWRKTHTLRIEISAGFFSLQEPQFSD
jgi:hypothetical protein